MGCNCKHVEIVLGAIVIIFAFWQVSYSQWIIAAAAALLIIHALTCKDCGACSTCAVPAGKAKSSSRPKKAAKKKRR